MTKIWLSFSQICLLSDICGRVLKSLPSVTSMPFGLSKYIFCQQTMSRKVKPTCSVLTISRPLSSCLNCKHSTGQALDGGEQYEYSYESAFDFSFDGFCQQLFSHVNFPATEKMPFPCKRFLCFVFLDALQDRSTQLALAIVRPEWLIITHIPLLDLILLSLLATPFGLLLSC